MYDSFKVRSDEEMEHLTQSNWRIISQKGNNCVRKQELDKTRNGFGGKTIRSQAFVFYSNRKPAFVLQIWPLHKPLTYPTIVVELRRKKLGI
jgi:hypothetical protein